MVYIASHFEKKIRLVVAVPRCGIARNGETG